MIKHLEIKRFKKFEHTVVTLNDLTVLVGENSSGKTTILQAINLSLNAFARQKLYSTDEAGVTKPRPKGVGTTQLPGILNDDFRELYYAKKSRNGRSNTNSIGCELHLVDEKGNRYGMQISSLFGGYNLTPLSKSEDLLHDPELHTKEALLISGYVGLVSSEEKALSLAIRNRLRDGRASEIIRNLLLDTKERTPENYQALIRRLKNDFGFVIDDVAFDETDDVNVHASYDEDICGAKIPFDFCASGSGMMQVLQILTSIYRYCPSNSTIVLLDEPDAHLHANMQVALFRSLREVQEELGIQIIISTHSTAIIAAASPNEIVPVSNAQAIGPLTNHEEVDELINERIDSYELSKIKAHGVLCFFEDKNIEYFLQCDKLLQHNMLIGSRTIAHLIGRGKDDKLPFGIRPVLKELFGQEISVFVIRDRDGLSSDVVAKVEEYAQDKEITCHFLQRYESESYLLIPSLIYRVLVAQNPDKDIPEASVIEEKIKQYLSDTINLARYNYATVLEDNLGKLSVYPGLENYRSSNEYRSKAQAIRNSYEAVDDLDSLITHGMGKEALKALIRWLNEECHLRISKKNLINALQATEISQEVVDLLQTIRDAMQ